MDTRYLGVQPLAPNEFTVHIMLFANGFQVNGGPFRSYERPENRDFISALSQNTVPQEISALSQGKPVVIALTDKRFSEFAEPRVPAQLAPPAADASNGVVLEPQLDPSQPTLNISIKFHNGTKKSIPVNPTTRVSELYDFARTSLPVPGNFTLGAGFPPKPLTDFSKTLSEINLQNNAILLQKLEKS